jgi:hypothetical protein
MINLIGITFAIAITALSFTNSARIISKATTRSHQSHASPPDYAAEFHLEMHRRSLYFKASLEAELRKRYETNMEQRYRQ